MKGKGSPVAPKEALVGKGDLGEALQDDPNEPIEINLAALADRIFLTDFGREFLDEFDLYAGGFSSQTTVLMQKQRQLEHLERLLDDKRKEFVKRMRKCERLERLQKEKEERLQNLMQQFEQFVRDNDSKRAGMLKRASELAAENVALDDQISGLHDELEMLMRRRAGFLVEIRKHEGYSSFVDTCLTKYSEFEDPTDMIRRFQTLVDTRSQLKRRLDRAMARLEQMRRSIQDEGERATTRLVTQTQLLGERQKTQSDLEGREGALTQAVEARIQATKDRREVLAEARNAITHLFQRLPKMRGQVLDWGNKDEDIWEMLKYIAVRMGDLGVMAQLKGQVPPEAFQRPHSLGLNARHRPGNGAKDNNGVNSEGRWRGGEGGRGGGARGLVTETSWAGTEDSELEKAERALEAAARGDGGSGGEGEGRGGKRGSGRGRGVSEGGGESESEKSPGASYPSHVPSFLETRPSAADSELSSGGESEATLETSASLRASRQPPDLPAIQEEGSGAGNG